MGLLAILMLFMVPKVTRHHKNFSQGYLQQLKQVLKMGDLNRLHFSVFSLHLLLTAMFVYIPSQLIEFAHIPLASHGMVYLPLLVVSLFLLFPVLSRRKNIAKCVESFDGNYWSYFRPADHDFWL